MKQLRRDGPLLVIDMGIVFSSYLVALVLRFEGAVPQSFWVNFRSFIAVILITHIASNYLFGLYGRVWEQASVHEARSLATAGIAAGVSIVVGDLVASEWMAGGRYPLPLSVVVLGAALSLLGFAAIRFYSRLFARRRRRVGIVNEPTRVLVVGTGSAGAMIIRDIQRNTSLGMLPVAAVDDDVRKVGRSLHGVPVVGGRELIPELVDRFKVDQVLLAIPSASSPTVREFAELCEQAEVGLRVLPTMKEVVGGRVTARDIRDVRIEDLLGRQQVMIDAHQVRGLLGKKRVLITGAGGSIGSEIARQAAEFAPEHLVLLDHDETHLHDVMIDVPHAVPVLADIRDRDRIFSLVEDFRPEIVFHAAAHKHVPILEAFPDEAFLTNVMGTTNVLDAAISAGSSRFVLISTDKAVNPSSIMGASKRLAEQVLWSRQGGPCSLSAVRFGNVLGSRGSVVTTFFRQIERGGPVTVTDPDMTRYFMSVEEAVQLVLQAAALSHGGEVFTLDMGEPVKIIDLARKVIQLSGRVPGRDVEIVLVGRRPGEKLYEDVVDTTEGVLSSDHPGIVVSRATATNAVSKAVLENLKELAVSERRADLARTMMDLLSGPLPQGLATDRPPLGVEA